MRRRDRQPSNVSATVLLRSRRWRIISPWLGPEAVRRRRARRIRALFDPAGLGLEIGPLDKPLCPKRDGFRVEVVDHTDAAGLRAKYRGDPNVNPDAIVDVDHVWDGRPLPDVIGTRGRHAWIVASHVIEHVPDPVDWMRDCAELLRPGGCLVLAVPDGRRCFDALRPVSTVGQLLQAHLERRTRHTPAAIFDLAAYSARRGGRPVWFAGCPGRLRRVGDVHGAWALAQGAFRSGAYHDTHGWVFTPRSFREAMAWLAELGILPLTVAVFRPTIWGEFLVALAKPEDWTMPQPPARAAAPLRQRARP